MLGDEGATTGTAPAAGRRSGAAPLEFDDGGPAHAPPRAGSSPAGPAATLGENAPAGAPADTSGRPAGPGGPPPAADGSPAAGGDDAGAGGPVAHGEPPLPDLTAAAFFDVDNTMMVGASIFHFARGLAARKYFTTADLAGFAWQQVKFRVGGREMAGSTSTSRDTALSFVAGRPVAEITALGEEIYDELMAERIWAGTRALAQNHLDAGQRVWLVTATPVELASIIARRLGLTGALGTVAETVDGVYTGRLVGEMLHGPAKAHAVRALAATEGLNLRRCTAYSDSVNDVPMLTVVGTAVAVNPDSELRDIAKERGWQIRDFRTGRKAARIGVPSVLGAGAIAVAAGIAYRKR